VRDGWIWKSAVVNTNSTTPTEVGNHATRPCNLARRETQQEGKHGPWLLDKQPPPTSAIKC